MSCNNRHFTLYNTTGLPPNGWKVVLVMEEMGLDYQMISLDFSKQEHKAPSYTKYNPNGRIPCLIDHKYNDFVVWESAAIILYLVDNYDRSHRLSFARYEEKILNIQWLFFQASGQGPYFGQAGWFAFFNPEKIPSAIERYQKEVLRVLGVLEEILAMNRYLVGGRMSVADISFIPWNHIATTALVKDYKGFNFERDFPNVYRWHNEMVNRPGIKKAMGMWQATMS